MNKICSKCNRELPVGAFRKNSKAKGGLRAECTQCLKDRDKAYALTDHGKEVRLKYAQSEEYKKARLLQAKTPEGIAARVKYLATEAGYAMKKAANHKYMKSLKYKQKQKERRENNEHRLHHAISVLIYHGIKGNKAGRTWQSLVDYSLQDLITHIQSQFQPCMTWDNFGKGGWEIDHIVPRRFFHFSKPDDQDFIRCWALDNLQPLWSIDNQMKSGKLVKPFQPSLDLLLKNNTPLDKIN
jgi:hypothetical protein